MCIDEKHLKSEKLRSGKITKIEKALELVYIKEVL